MTTEFAFTIAGFACAVAGIWLKWGAGSALLVAGLVMFVAGGLASREQRRW